MNDKTGYKETAAAVSMFSLSPAVLVLIANLSSTMNAGAWINFVVNSCYILLALWVLRYYFSAFDSDITEAARKVCGTALSKVTGIVFLILIFLYTSFNFGLYTDSVSKLGFFSYSREYISIFPIAASVISAYPGVEGNTRTSYVIFFLTLLLGLFCVFSTAKAWDTENLFPIMGTDGAGTFLSFRSAATYPGIAALFVINRQIGDKSKVLSCAYRCLATVFFFTLAMLLIYILSVPYPINRLYTFSAEGIFSSTLSGELFHRFEIFLISLCILFDIATTSFGILLCAILAARLSGAEDIRPFVLIFGLIVFCFDCVKITPDAYLDFCSIMTAVSLAVPAVLLILIKMKGLVKK